MAAQALSTCTLVTAGVQSAAVDPAAPPVVPPAEPTPPWLPAVPPALVLPAWLALPPVAAPPVAFPPPEASEPASPATPSASPAWPELPPSPASLLVAELPLSLMEPALAMSSVGTLVSTTRPQAPVEVSSTAHRAAARCAPRLDDRFGMGDLLERGSKLSAQRDLAEARTEPEHWGAGGLGGAENVRIECEPDTESDGAEQKSICDGGKEPCLRGL